MCLYYIKARQPDSLFIFKKIKKKMETKEPYVFLLDLDGTMQGNVLPQLKEYELNEAIKHHDKRIRYNLNQLFSDMARGLIRPHLRKALVDIKSKHPNVEFFVYTASSDQWARFLLPKIIRFLFKNEPIVNSTYLTRSDCLSSGMKSLAKVRPKVARALGDKYPNATFKNMYLVDNSFVLHSNEFQHLIHCPTYDYKVLNCPLRNFSPQVLERHFRTLSLLLLQEPSKTKIQFIQKYYNNAFKEFVATDTNNARYANDKYWPNFRGVFMKYRHLTRNNIDTVVEQLKQIKQY